MLQKKIAIDMDEVLADTLSEHLRLYNRDFEESVTKIDLEGKTLWDLVSNDRHDQLLEYLQAEDFFADLPLMPGAVDGVRELSKRYEVFIASAAMTFPNSLGPKYRWLERHFPFIPPTHYVFCGDKSILGSDYLIDDIPRNFKRFKGRPILFSAPHNSGVTGYRKARNWEHVLALLAEDEAEEQA